MAGFGGAHVMTPARKAALRKAQLASAAKRRKHGPLQATTHALGQKGSYYAASAQVKAHGIVRRPSVQSKKQHVKTFAKNAALAAGIAAAVTAGGAAHKKVTTGHFGPQGASPKVRGAAKQMAFQHAMRNHPAGTALHKPGSRPTLRAIHGQKIPNPRMNKAAMKRRKKITIVSNKGR